MLIGCCHCDEPSESSIPSEPSVSEPSVSESQSMSVSDSASGSQSAESSGESDVSGCTPCETSLGFRPAAMRVSWSLVDRTPGSAAFLSYPGMGNCYSGYSGPFIVRYDSTIANAITDALPSGVLGSICGWHSADVAGGRALRSHDCATTGAEAKASVWVVVTGSAPNRVWSITAFIEWSNTSGGVRVYGSPGESGRQGGITYQKTFSESIGQSLDCFGTHTLSFLFMPRHGSSPSTRFAGGPGFNYYLDSSGTIVNTFPATITVEAL